MFADCHINSMLNQEWLNHGIKLIISYYVIPTIFACHRKYKINKYQSVTLII